jgi:hypothetical protein
MEPAAEKREAEQEELQQQHDEPAVPSADDDEAEAEENERRNRELKAGFHPLRVSTPPPPLDPASISLPERGKVVSPARLEVEIE